MAAGVQIHAIVTDGENRLGLSDLQVWNAGDYNTSYLNGPRFYVITDRPVYRPGSTVKFRIWVRQRENGKYLPPRTGDSVNVEIYDAKNSRVVSLSPTLDESGSISGEFALDANVALGVYSFASIITLLAKAMVAQTNSLAVACSGSRSTRSRSSR